MVKITGTIANTDTGTYTPRGKPLLGFVAGKPMIVGLPYGISAAIASRT
jgi:hypothetical protein